eukprot:968604-Prorocentrum_minimum.AAC.2
MPSTLQASSERHSDVGSISRISYCSPRSPPWERRTSMVKSLHHRRRLQMLQQVMCDMNQVSSLGWKILTNLGDILLRESTLSRALDPGVQGGLSLSKSLTRRPGADSPPGVSYVITFKGPPPPPVFRPPVQGDVSDVRINFFNFLVLFSERSICSAPVGSTLPPYQQPSTTLSYSILCSKSKDDAGARRLATGWNPNS